MSAALGGAFSAGMASYNFNYRYTPSFAEGSLQTQIELAQSAAMTNLLNRQREWEQAGFQLNEVGKSSLAVLPIRLKKAIEKTLQNYPIPPEWSVLAVEQPLQDYGNARPDIVLHDGVAPLVVDYKLKLTLDARYRQKTLVEFGRSWQMNHYAWACAEAMNQKIDRYAIILVVLEPKFSIEFLSYPIQPEALAQWLRFAQQTWADMEAEDNGTRVTRGQTKCANEFGPCPYIRYCWELFGESHLLSQDYVGIPELKESA